MKDFKVVFVPTPEFNNATPTGRSRDAKASAGA